MTVHQNDNNIILKVVTQMVMVIIRCLIDHNVFDCGTEGQYVIGLYCYDYHHYQNAQPAHCHDHQNH